MHKSEIYRVLMKDPFDVRELENLIDNEGLNPAHIQCIMISHEGDMFAKQASSMAFAYMLAKKLGKSVESVIDALPLQGIAGVAGFMVPHAIVFVRGEASDSEIKSKRLSIAGGNTKGLLPEEKGSLKHAREVSRRTRELIDEAGIEPGDVKFIFVKGQWASLKDKEEVESRGKKLLADDWWTLGALGRAACALGAAHAIGEISDDELDRVRFIDDAETVYSRVVHVSAGEERPSDAIVVLGNSQFSSSDLIIENGVLRDDLDRDGMKSILRNMGFDFDCCPTQEQVERVQYAFIKPKAHERPTFRGYRHTLESELHLGHVWWIVEKVPIHSVASELLGTTVMEVATGSEHQGPLGQPLMAVIAKAV